MSLTSTLALVFKSELFLRLAKVVGSSLLTLVTLGWIVEHAGPPSGRAVVHVTESDVTVQVGGNTYEFAERPLEPIVCELRPGKHELTMTRDGRVLYEQTFRIRRGESVVLTAWDPERLRRGRDSRFRPMEDAHTTR